MNAAICGAGPAGAFLSFLLARGGVAVTLIERHTDFSREFRGEGLSPSGMAAIREAGLWEDFVKLPSTPLESMKLYSAGKPFLELDLARVLPRDMSFIRVMAQEHLLEMLADKASAFSNFTILRGSVVQDVIEANGRVVGVRVVDSDRNSRDISADYVIAADGRYSLVRKRAKLELEGKLQEFDVVWCKIPRPPQVQKGRVYGFLLADFFGLIFPTEHDRLQIGRIIPKGSYRQFRETSDDWYDRILEVLPTDLRSAFAAQRDRASAPVLLDVVCGALPRWSAPGLCFIGDAAHPMSPIGAQGINIALRDAVVAANHFGPLLVKGAAPEVLDAAAAAFEKERRTEVDKIQSQQNNAARQLVFGRALAPLLRVIPDEWVAALATFALGRRTTRNFIEGAAPLRLTFETRADQGLVSDA